LGAGAAQAQRSGRSLAADCRSTTGCFLRPVIDYQTPYDKRLTFAEVSLLFSNDPDIIEFARPTQIDDAILYLEAGSLSLRRIPERALK